MWQFRIIIEISSRKELLGPIWSLPRGQGSIIPSSTLSSTLSGLVVVVWRWHSLQCCPQHSRHNLMDYGVDSAFSMEFFFHILLKRASWQKQESPIQHLAYQLANQLE